jgi:hypothetical protein
MRCLEAFVPRQIAFEAHCRDGNEAEVTNYSITWSARARNDSKFYAQARGRLHPTTSLSESCCAPQQIGVVDFRLGSKCEVDSLSGHVR